jgi:hypothetical protein
MAEPKIVELVTTDGGPCWVEEGSAAHRDRLAAGFREAAAPEADEVEAESDEQEAPTPRRGKKGGRR